MPQRDSADSSFGNANISRHLARMARAHPRGTALKVPRGRTRAGEIDYLTLSFAELDTEVAAWGHRLTRAGIVPGMRTLVMVRQGLPLIASVFALFRAGAVPVVIDPGMGWKNFLACVAHSRPRGLVGLPMAQLVSRLFRSPFRSVVARVSASASLTARLSTSGASPPPPPSLGGVESSATDLAAVLFTSGSTGAPKGVCYEHGMFDAQVRLIRDAYRIEPGEVDLPLLPIFALFNPALGMTTVVPEIDPRRPAALDPAKIVQAIRQENVTNSFGSPTLWRKIADHCRATQATLPSLRRVLCAGAAVPATLWSSARTLLPAGKLHSPYGATEALPVTTISSDEIDPRSTRGACVGRAVREIEIRIIGISDTPIAALTEAPEVPPGAVGEIIVCGPVVTKTYDALPEATQRAKIPAEDPPYQPRGDRNSIGAAAAAVLTAGAGAVSPGAERASPAASAGSAAPVWHRMGDCGYLDAEGRLWFCGRKVERVETAAGTLHTEPCEQVFRQHPRAARCALIGLGERGRQEPAIVVETRIRSAAEGRALARELRALAEKFAHTSAIATFYFRARFPVDVRHNAKIHRLTLAAWAARAQKFEPDMPS